MPDFVVSTLLSASIPVSLPKCSYYLTIYMPHHYVFLLVVNELVLLATPIGGQSGPL